MKTAYYTFILESQKDFLVYVPDMDIFTEGKSIPEAMEMARDAIGLKILDYEDDKKVIPNESTAEEAIKKAKSNTDIADYSKGILTLVDVDIEEYRKKIRNQAVKKNCTLPYWLCEEAENAGINFSRVLQDALMEKMNIAK